VIVEDFTLYGHLSSFESHIKDILIIIVTARTGKPGVRVITFKQHSDGFNRLYFFNAMQNFLNPQKGNMCTFHSSCPCSRIKEKWLIAIVLVFLCKLI
jgi:hypothetical protein